MELNFLQGMAYLIVAITLITMIFGILAYLVYKIREKKRAQRKGNTEESNEEKAQYLFFQKKEMIL